MNDDVISLQDYLVVLKRQRLVVVLTTVLVVVAALAFSFAQTPVYEAQTDIAIERVRATGDVSLEDLLSPAFSATETERVVMTSRSVADRVAASLGLDDPADALEGVRVEAVRDTRVLRVIVADNDPAAAAGKADAFADAYLDFRRDQAVDEVLAARANIDERGASLRAQLAELDELLADADQADDREALEVQREALLAQLGQVIAQSAELGVSADDITGGGVVLTPAEVPETPVAPRPARTGALAVVLGLLLGVGVAFLRDYLDDVVRDEVDFKRSTGGRPVLGRIPRWQPADGDVARLATVVEPASLAAESYRELSAGVRFLLIAHGAEPDLGAADDPLHEPSAHADQQPVSWDIPVGDKGEGPRRSGRSIMVVSASASEGKSSTAANLAVAAARVGMRTVLVDADLRRATLHKRFGLARGTGLCDVLLGDGSITDHVVDVGIDNLLLLPAGTIPPNPTELLASSRMSVVRRALQQRADLVIYDTPAVLAVPDPLELGRYVDLAILVGRSGLSSRRQLAAAIERLEQVGTDLAGTVLNDLDTRSEGYYYSYYYEHASRTSGGLRQRLPGRAATSTRSQEGAASAAAPEGDPAAAGGSTPAGATDPEVGGGQDAVGSDPLIDSPFADGGNGARPKDAAKPTVSRDDRTAGRASSSRKRSPDDAA